MRGEMTRLRFTQHGRESVKMRTLNPPPFGCPSGGSPKEVWGPGWQGPDEAAGDPASQLAKTFQGISKRSGASGASSL